MSSLTKPCPPAHPAAMTAPMLLLRNADVYAPESLGRRQLLLGGGKILWMGEDAPTLPASLAARRQSSIS